MVLQYRALTSSFFSSTERTSLLGFDTGLTISRDLGDSGTGARRKDLWLSDEIRLEVMSGEFRLGEDADEGRPRVISDGKAFCERDGLRWTLLEGVRGGGARD